MLCHGVILAGVCWMFDITTGVFSHVLMVDV